MKKRIILGSIVLILITATSCNINTDNNESNISDSQTQSIDTSSTLSQPQSSAETLSKPESQVLSTAESENNQDSEIDYMQVLKNFRWFFSQEWDSTEEIDKFHFAMWYAVFLKEHDPDIDFSKYMIEDAPGASFLSSEMEPIVEKYFSIKPTELKSQALYVQDRYELNGPIGPLPDYDITITNIEKLQDTTNIYFTLTDDSNFDGILVFKKVLTISNDEIPRYISIKNSK